MSNPAATSWDAAALQRSVQAEAMARANGLLSIRSAEIGAIPDLAGRLAAFEASLIVVGAVAMFRGSAAVQRADMMPAPQFLTRTAMRRTVRTVGASEPPANRSTRHAASLMRLFSCPDSVRCMPAMAGGARAKARKGTNKAAQTPACGQVRLGSEPPAASGSVRSLVGGVHRQPQRLPMTNSVIPRAHALAITDITATADPAEPRILDVRLAEALGFADPRMIRKLITRHIDTLRAFGRCDTVEHRPARGGRAEQRYYLNRKQAVYIAAKSETDRAVEITIQVVEIFDAVTRDRNESEPTIPVVAHRRRQALARVDDISRLSALIDRLEEQDDHHKGMAMPIRDGMAMVRIDRKILLIDLSVSVGFTGTALIIDRDDGNVRLGEVCETGSPLTQMLGGPRTAMTVSPKRSGRWPCQVIGRLVDIRRAPTDRPSRARDPDDGIKALRAELEQGFRRMLDDMTAGAARQKGSS